jgi:hypothetical protein
MKFSVLATLCVLASSTDALSQPSTAGRRAFLAQAATAAASVAVASPAVAATKDQYSLELDETYKKEAPEKKSSNSGNIVGAAFGGGLLLSLPFFAPNLARMAGIKNAKTPK